MPGKKTAARKLYINATSKNKAASSLRCRFIVIYRKILNIYLNKSIVKIRLHTNRLV
jgi:hypothetical protein